MKAKIEVDMDNAAFEDDAKLELWGVLIQAAGAVWSGEAPHAGYGFTLRDTNGNLVGQLVIEE